MTRSNKYILLFFLFCIFYVIIGISDTVMHEEAHKAFAVYNGCTEYKTHIGLFGGSFQCLSRDSPQHDDAEYILDSMNEIISYNIMSLTIFIILCTVFLFLVVTL